MAEVTIEVRPNGPYIITGPIELRDTTGTAGESAVTVTQPEG
jgi:CDGSH-type Zn-finger protein